MFVKASKIKRYLKETTCSANDLRDSIVVLSQVSSSVVT